MIRILAIGDPHAKRDNTLQIVELAERCAKIATEERVDFIVVLGDLHNDFARMHLQVMQAICKFFDILTERHPVFYIVGNHDMLNNQVFLTDDHFFVPFKKWKNLTIVDTPFSMSPVFEDPFTGNKGLHWTWNSSGNQIGFCPYVPPGRLIEALNSIDANWKQCKIIFAHQEIRNANFGSFISETGDEWESNQPLLVIGHNHEKGWINDNVLQVGTPFQQTFAESPDKTVSLIEIDDNDKISIRERSLGFPIKQTLEMDVDKAMAWVPEPDREYKILLSDTSEKLTIFKKSTKYKELYSTTKLVAHATDIIVVKEYAAKPKGYLELFREATATDSDAVKSLMEEVIKDAH